MDDLRERLSIVDTVTKLFVHTDARDWNAVKELLAPRVEFDMTSLTGDRPSVLTPGQITDAWEKALKPLKAVHHQSGNFLVEIRGSEADVFCYAVAWHYLPNRTGKNMRMFAGTYNIHVVKSDEEWKIDAFRYNSRFVDGNADLEKSL